jgi:hypothetical protein
MAVFGIIEKIFQSPVQYQHLTAVGNDAGQELRQLNFLSQPVAPPL